MRNILFASVSVLALSAGAAFAGSNVSHIDQIGSSNGANILQTSNGGNNTSTVNQGNAGNGNASKSSTADVEQIGASSSTLRSTVTQNDSRQQATVTQKAGAGAKQTSTIKQDGDGYRGSNPEGNKAKVTQDTRNAGSATQNSTVTQHNDSNEALVRQTADTSTDNQRSTITQSGRNGLVSVSQVGPSDRSTVTQTGNNNDDSWAGRSSGVAGLGTIAGGVKVDQRGSTTNHSTITQGSNYSGISVKQTGSAGVNTSTVDQDSGSHNVAGVLQEANGGTNTSRLDQSGNWNTAGVWQTAGAGVTNLSTINQAGYNNAAYVHQH